MFSFIHPNEVKTNLNHFCRILVLCMSGLSLIVVTEGECPVGVISSISLVNVSIYLKHALCCLHVFSKVVACLPGVEADASA